MHSGCHVLIRMLEIYSVDGRLNEESIERGMNMKRRETRRTNEFTRNID